MNSVHINKVFLCCHCGFESKETENLREHFVKNHENNDASKQQLEKDFKELRENYERLIAINKKLTEQAKDKKFAVQVHVEELRNGYE